MQKEKRIKYELEMYELKVTSQNGKANVSDKTRTEHKKIIGIFCVLKGGSQPNFQSTIKISVDREPLVSDVKFHPFIIEKTNALSVEEAMWMCDKDINNSDVKIEYRDGGEQAEPYTLNVYFVCEK